MAKQDDLPGMDPLYERYLHGETTFRGQNSEVLQIAREVGMDLRPDEFEVLRSEVESVLIQEGSLPQNEFHSKMWDIPERMATAREKPNFVPVRTKSNAPVDLDYNDPNGTEERLKALPYSEVKHDPSLRDAWHAAQAGKLAELMRNDSLWQTNTDTKTLGEAFSSMPSSQRSLVSGPLKSLLNSHDRDELAFREEAAFRNWSRDKETHAPYKEDTDSLIARLSGDRHGLAFEAIPQSLHVVPFGGVMLRDIRSQSVEQRNPQKIRDWHAGVKEHHEKAVRQQMVNWQIQSLQRTSVPNSNRL